MNKIAGENIAKNKGRGRPKGSKNKTTATAKAIIEQASDKIGGAERLTAWIKEDPANERAFWSTIFPKLMPLQVNGSAPSGGHIFHVMTGVPRDDD